MYTLMGISVFLGVVSGVVAETVIFRDYTLAVVATIVAVVCFICSRMTPHAGRVFVVCGVACASVAVGIVRVEIAPPVYDVPTAVGEVSLSGVVVSEEEAREHARQFVMRLADGERVLVRTAAPVRVSWYDTVTVVGVARSPEAFASDGGRVFNYPGFLGKDNIHTIVDATSITVVNHTRSLRGTLSELKHAYTSALARLLREPATSLAAGITVGERRGLGRELTDAFRDVGLIHIVVLSGYNIAIILIAVMALLYFVPTATRAIVALCFIVLFVLLVGPSATVVRAGIMGGIAAIGMIANRTYGALHALFLASLAMVLHNPHIVLYDPSFQLSFMATLGLLVGAPTVAHYLTWIPERGGFREIIATTIGTQLAVTPLLLFLMGTVSVVALVANVVVLPIIPLAMALSACAGVVGMVVDPVAFACAYPAQGVLDAVVAFVLWLRALPIVTVTAPVISPWVLAGMYVLLSGVLYILKKHCK